MKNRHSHEASARTGCSDPQGASRAEQSTPFWRNAAVQALAFFLLTSLIAPGVALAATADPSLICDRVASIAAARTGVPISVLKAISLNETGRKRDGAFRPWPWTVNMEGKGVWFDSDEEARAFVDENFARGARSFDVGCFQINYKWHHQNFSSLDAMFDPLENALYAARFLIELYSESGDWEIAAGAYHSRNPEYADRYKARFAGFRTRFLHEDGLPLRVAAADMADPLSPGAEASAPIVRVRVNSFPLLQGSGDTAIGSLVPLSAKGAPGSLFTSGGHSLFAPEETG